MPTTETTNELLLATIERLLGCCELNLDEIDPATAEAIEAAQDVLARAKKTNLTETWNTGRFYQRDGQIIIATWHAEDGVVTFNDVSRMITGELKQRYPQAPASLRSAVMHGYDHNQYDASRRAWQDASGCNSSQGAAA